MNNLKIMMLSSFPPEKCAVADYTWSLSRHLIKLDEIDRIYILTSKLNDIGLPRANNQYPVKGLSVFRFYDRGNKKSNVIFHQNLLKMVKKFDPSLLHIQYVQSIYPRSFPLLPLLRKLPEYVITVHEVPKLVEYIRPLRLLLTYSKKIIVHNLYSKRILNEKYKISTNNIVIIPCGAEIIKKGEKGRRRGKKILVFGAADQEKKNWPLLFEAFKYALQIIPDLELIIAGKGAKNVKIETRYAQSIRKHIKLIDFVSEQKMQSLFLEANLLVLPYIRCFQSWVCAKAQGMGKAVIATRVGGLKEQIDNGKTGLLVSPSDPSEMGEAIVNLLHEEEKLKSIAHNAYIHAKNELSWDKIASKTYCVYKEVMK